MRSQSVQSVIQALEHVARSSPAPSVSFATQKISLPAPGSIDRRVP